MADRCIGVAEDLSGDQVAAICTAFADMTHRHRALLASMSSRAQRPEVLQALAPEPAAALLEAFAALGHNDKGLIKAVIQQFRAHATEPTLTISALSRLAWALAEFKVTDKAVLPLPDVPCGQGCPLETRIFYSFFPPR